MDYLKSGNIINKYLLYKDRAASHKNGIKKSLSKKQWKWRLKLYKNLKKERNKYMSLGRRLFGVDFYYLNKIDNKARRMIAIADALGFGKEVMATAKDAAIKSIKTAPWHDLRLKK